MSAAAATDGGVVVVVVAVSTVDTSVSDGDFPIAVGNDVSVAVSTVAAVATGRGAQFEIVGAIGTVGDDD